MSQQYPQYTNSPNQPLQPGEGFSGNPPYNPMPEPQLQPPPKKRRRWVPWVVAAGTFLLGLIIGTSGSNGSGSPTAGAGVPQPTVTKTVPGPAGATVAGPTVTQTVPGPAKTVTAPPPAPKAAITEDGVFLVGTDIKPGTYRNGNEGDCYWARLKNTEGDLDGINANGNGGNQVVTIKKTDKAFETRRCGSWARIG
ncbi:hypothetical protein EV649_1573 [Kribbella sp. VKM Ac-2569]|uniref:hypothetical protein n=1 Tax=Kribbella sp. VKM Ac-2569 TaxID=2512220 RepID=UPI00102B46D8|nr:hypothetical protein [Kribbella sp. VKM Ac-2569]RZT27800.1 hypothetical protein EV649_1573 [Kribbella sp. VKM Ac-2569]